MSALTAPLWWRTLQSRARVRRLLLLRWVREWSPIVTRRRFYRELRHMASESERITGELARSQAMKWDAVEECVRMRQTFVDALSEARAGRLLVDAETLRSFTVLRAHVDTYLASFSFDAHLGDDLLVSDVQRVAKLLDRLALDEAPTL